MSSEPPESKPLPAPARPTNPLAADPASRFFGPRIVLGASVVAGFGWGTGFYGPPIFLHSVVARTGWPLEFVSFAMTVHFLVGAVVIANLPRLHERFGLPWTTTVGALATALGVLGWAGATERWHLLLAVVASGAGWVTMGAAAINAFVAPWYVRDRPRALGRAYNGASVGGAIFSPLWVLLIGLVGFFAAAGIVGAVMTAVVAVLAWSLFARTPAQMGQAADGDAPGARAPAPPRRAHGPLPGARLFRTRSFLTLAAGMAAGLFAQVGLLAHLFSLMVPVTGARVAGVLMGLATACAIGGRVLAVRLIARLPDRRLVACVNSAVQVVGVLVLLAAGESRPWLIAVGVVLFGTGIGNSTSLPPLVAQAEFEGPDVQRAVAAVVAFGQATYSFAPAAFGLLLALSEQAPRIGAGATGFFVAALLMQLLAIACFLVGRPSRP